MGRGLSKENKEVRGGDRRFFTLAIRGIKICGKGGIEGSGSGMKLGCMWLICHCPLGVIVNKL